MTRFGGPRWVGEIDSPLDVSDCALWLDATTLELEHEDPVALWSDLSGSGYHAVQADLAKQPTYDAEAQNGLPGVLFTADPRYMTLPTAGGLLQAVDGYSAFVTFRENQAGYLFAVSDGDGNGNYRLGLRAEIGDSRSLNVGNADDDYADVTVPADSGDAPYARSQAAVVDFVRGLDNIVVSWWDGSLYRVTVAPGTPGPTPDTASDVVTLGVDLDESSRSAEGHVCELVVYRRALKSAERRKVVEYLSSRWGTLD